MDNHEGDTKVAYCQDVDGSTNNRNTLVEVASASARNEGLAGTLPNNSGTVRLACAASSATVDSLPLKPISEDVPMPGPSLMNGLDGAQDNSSANIKANATAEGAEGKTPGLTESSPKGATRANMVSPAPEPAEAEIAMLPALQQCGTVADAHKRLYVAVAITYMASLSFGFALGYSAPALPGLRKSMAFSKSDSGWFASLVPLGAIVGGLTGGRVLNTIGRRGALIVAALWFLTGWFCLAIGALKEVLFLGRVLTGVGTGTAALAVSVFISEISPPELRGFLNTGANLVLKSGIFFVYILGKFLNFWSLAIVCLIPAAIMTVALFWCHESPRWLLKKGHHQRASRALYFYGGPGAEAHLASLERVVSPGLDPAAAGGFTARDLTLPHIYRPTLCVLLAVTMQQMSAINAILAYAHDIFEEAGTTISADYAAITFSAIQVVMVGLTAVLCDRLGRKPLLLFSSLGTCASLGVLGLSFHLKATAGATFTDSFGWLPLAALCSYIIVYSMGLGPLPWVLLGEMIPLKVKGFATGICTAMLFGEGFVVAKTYNELTAAIGTAATYWMYSASLALGFILTLLFVPETKGRDLDEIEYLFGKPPSRCSPVQGAATEG